MSVRSAPVGFSNQVEIDRQAINRTDVNGLVALKHIRESEKEDK